MSKVNQIQAELRAISDGSFHKLCDLYLRQNPRYADLKSIGSVAGKDKSKSGVPDALITLPDGTFAFAHYTTQESGLPAKLQEDFASSFNETHTGVPVDQIAELIFCHNRRLSTQQELAIIQAGREHNITVRFFGLEKIAYDLFDRYPGLARECLSVEVDTGQIVSPQQFVSRYNRTSPSTRLDTTFDFREAELQRVVAALGTQDLVFITGGSGVGKSRLMLEAALRFSSHDAQWTVQCVYNRGADLFQDLRTYFNSPGNHLILIDDANRLSGFTYVLQLLHDQTSDVRIKIIATVRDYARDLVLQQAESYGNNYVEPLQPFTDDQIRTLIAAEEGITSYHYRERIVSLARGNPRLAMMAARVAREHQTLASISDVTSLYDEYFGSVRRDLKELDDKRVIAVAGVVAFFRIVDRSNDQQMGAIAEAFDIPPSAFWQTVEELHRLELVDLYENEVAKFSDQVLATYLFYLAVFKTGTLNFSTLLDHFFPSHTSLFIDSLNPVINSLGAQIEDSLRPHIDRKWKALESAGQEEDLIALIRAFWFVRQTETLLYIRRTQASSIQNVDVDSLDFSSESHHKPIPLLDLLGVFHGTRHCNTALSLVLDIFERDALSLPNVLRLLKEDFGFRPHSSLRDFALQRAVINQVLERTKNGENPLLSRLFMAIATHYLRTNFEHTESHRMSVSFVQFTLEPTPTLLSLRRTIWTRIFKLYSLPKYRAPVLGLLRAYSRSGYQVSGKELVADDAEMIQPFLLTALDPNNIDHVLLVQEYLVLLDRVRVTSDPAVRKRFTSDAGHLGELLVNRRHRDGESFEESEARQDRELRAHVKDFTVDDYRGLFRQCLELQEAMPESDKWELRRSIGKLFSIIEEGGADLYVPVATFYLELGSPFALSGRQVVDNLVRFCGATEAYEIISSRDYPDRGRYLFDFFATLPPGEVDATRLNQLYDLYRTSLPTDLPTDFEFLGLYIPIDSRALAQVVELLLSRLDAEENGDIAFRLSFLWNNSTETTERLLSHFDRGDLALLKRVYLIGQGARDHADHGGSMFGLILDRDKGFLREYLAFLVSSEKNQGKGWVGRDANSKDFSFLWNRSDYDVVMRDALEFLFELQKSDDMYVGHLLEALFTSNRGDEPTESGNTQRQVEVLGALIAERAMDGHFMEFVFQIVGGLPEARRQELLAIFLSRNANVEDFKRLSLQPMSGGWTGSAVPFYQKKLEFAESLLPLVEGLDYLEHRLHLERWIESLQRQIEIEKRRDFMREV